jgi:hypothetical protein
MRDETRVGAVERARLSTAETILDVMQTQQTPHRQGPRAPESATAIDDSGGAAACGGVG